MKTCLTCQKTYDDDTMVYCLDDGTRLVDQYAAPRDDNATFNLPVSPTIAAAPRSPTPTAPNPATITAKPEHFQMPPAYRPAETEPTAQEFLAMDIRDRFGARCIGSSDGMASYARK